MVTISYACCIGADYVNITCGDQYVNYQLRLLYWYN